MSLLRTIPVTAAAITVNRVCCRAIGNSTNIRKQRNIEPELKEQAEAILTALGIPASNAITMFYRQVISSGRRFKVDLFVYCLDGLFQSVLCRSRADWLVGINASRFFSLTYGCKLKHWPGHVPDAGPAGAA